jgi:hypothetical protein
MEDEAIPLDKLVKIYRKLRTKMTELTQKYDTETEVLSAQQDEIRNAIKDQMKAMGVTSVRTTEGTAVLSVKTRYTTQDWDSFKKFMIEHEAIDLVEKRIAQLNMKQFLEENPGVVPPGLNSASEYDISVRKPT